MRINTIEQKYVEIVSQVRCDCCGKDVDFLMFDDNGVRFSAHHSGWGNDSVESFEYYDACSVNCYYSLLEKAVEEFSRYSDSAEIDDKPFSFVKEMISKSK